MLDNLGSLSIGINTLLLACGACADAGVADESACPAARCKGRMPIHYRLPLDGENGLDRGNHSSPPQTLPCKHFLPC